MRKLLLGLVAVTAVAAPVALVSAPANADAGSPGCVTRAEFKKVDTRGRDASTRTQVTRIFGTHGKVQYRGSGGVGVEYRTCAGDSTWSYVDVDFDNGKAWFKWMYISY